MRILEQGYGPQVPEWHVLEERAPGYCRVYYILGGRLQYRDRYGQRPLYVGELYVFPAHAPYEITHDPTDPLRCLWFHLDLFPALLDRLIAFPVASTLACVLEALVEEYRHGRAEGEVYGRLVEVLYAYMVDSGCLIESDSRLGEMLGAIHAAYREVDFSVGSLCARLGYSPEHLIRTFGAYMHTSPYQYAIDLRLREAQGLLLAGHSVSRTAEAVGYRDSKAFSQAFKAKYGIPPSKCREEYTPRA